MVKEPTRAWGSISAAILQALEEFGPMTCTELAEHLGIDRYNVSGVLSRLRKPGKQTPQRVYVLRYVRVMEGQRQYPRAVVALGDSPDATPPRPIPRKTVRRRSDAGVRARNTLNFVFNMATPRRAFNTRKRTDGKTQTARALAAALRPPDGPTVDETAPAGTPLAA